MTIQELQKQLDEMYANNELDEAYSFLVEQVNLAVQRQDNATILFLLNEMIGYFRVTSQFQSGNQIALQIFKILDMCGLEETIDGATSYINIATFYRVQGKYQEALSLYQKTEKIYHHELEPYDELYSAFYNNLSLLYQEMGDYHQAIDMQKKALAIVEQLDDYRIEEAITYTNLSQMYLSINQNDEAQKCLHQAISLFQQYGPHDPHYFASLATLAQSHYMQKDYVKALDIYHRVLYFIESVYGQNKDYQTIQKNIDRIQKEMKTIKGLDLCEAFYQQYGRNMIEEEFSEIKPYMAVGLLGMGSDCLGYDDEISHDHDFGPGFCILLPHDIYQQYYKQIQASYQKLPQEFMGIQRLTSAHGNGRVGVFETESFFKQFLRQIPQTLDDWLYADENALLACTNGRIFEDNYGQVTQIRQYLSYYPEDIRIKKIARCLAKMAQSGQYNYARCMQREDEVAATLALNEFIDQTLSLLYLLNKKYKPYYKWSYYGLKDCTCLQAVTPLLLQLVQLPSQKQHWPQKNNIINTDDQKVVLIEKICQLVIGELHRQGLSTSDDDFLDNHTLEVMSHIQDDHIRMKHVMEG